ncbi:MAG: chemotaxis protein CheW [Xenococcaceae cyanobacterium MO_188.B29]|nr:chemotaxis protein CheW [Xenococcaceae cyanobacterium MO_188.B29]
MIQLPESISTLDNNSLQNIPQQEGQRFLRFFLTPEVDGLLPLAELQQVINLSLENILPVPQMAKMILGVINWQGKATWIVDLANLWGACHWCQREPIPDAGMAIVVPWKDETIGLLIEQVKTIEIYNPQHCLPISEGMFSEELRSLARGYSVNSQGKTWIVLDIPSIMQAIA